ncbi:hypothetical protein NUU61_002293 [Penicillium alfredii]|uniref:Uncharacterized protein n=1 Tax=Penicillium alfredii TaxID=1506179 RepID=A0A9W9FR78_9EURO|nr:uncharacterized protein NUU61_002293 [Penicillium alfredii]KAJ5104946.1 hypothetical protein NUU61_002293 [Penicillium alfredii]
MFSRRKRSSSHHQEDRILPMEPPVPGHKLTSTPSALQPLPTPASQSAQSAASHAFLQSQPSSSSLSSAAAAAALRNLSPTPTPVEDVQTKRMVQRRASTQSQASPIVTRRSASVSGTLRRSNSSSSMTARTFREQSPHRPISSSGPVDVPPLPSLPAQYEPRKLPSRRAVSMEPTARLPPGSPKSPQRSGVRGVSVDRERDRGSAAHSAPHHRVTSLSTVPEVERPVSRGSVNFSYPMGVRPNSPNSFENRPMNLDEAAARELPSSDVTSIQQSISHSSDKPVNGRARSHVPGGAGGNHVENKSAVTPSVGTALAAAQAVSPQKSNARVDHVHTQAERTSERPLATNSLDSRVGNVRPSVVTSSATEHPSSRAVPERWPSAVPEQPEPEGEEANTNIANAREGGIRLASASPTVDHVEALSSPQSVSSAEYSPAPQPDIRQSSSPGRSARFSKWLSVTTGDQMHEPPPRSVSPGKSALKHPRGNSLSPDRKTGVAGRGIPPPSEISDGTSVASDEGPRVGARKKPVKVSFDDEAEIVGVAASPPTSPEEYIPESPPGKAKSRMSWFGVGKKKSSPVENATGDDFFDEVLKPRPVLPSFGSVRNREAGFQGPKTQEFSDNDSTTSSESPVASTPGFSFSNDHTFGGILLKDQHKEQPKPHVVDSLEQKSVNGGSSPTQTTGSGVKPDGAAVISFAEKQPYSGVDSQLSVPAIAVQPATPQPESHRSSLEQPRSSLEQYKVPGGFPPPNSDRNLKGAANATKAAPVASAVPKLDDMDTEGESGDSVYSDAAEDFDGDGFGSINAILDGRPMPRATGALRTISESRDTTPRPADRATIVDSQTRDVANQASEETRSVTPTQESVNRQVEGSPTSPTKLPFESPYPPLPIKSKARAYKKQNGIQNEQTYVCGRPWVILLARSSVLEQQCSPGVAKSKPRPVSLGPAFQRMSGPGASAGFPNHLRRTLSNGSDSSSSFKRSTPSPREDGPHSMRRTMRAGGQVRVQSPSNRVESPTEHRPLSAGSSTGTMRKTLRGPGAGGERYSFFSTNKRAPRTKPGKSGPKSTRASRFRDSDDEGDEDRPQVFRSRFADSSDEDEPGSNTLRPVRGIPRRKGAHDGDSTELEDSSEEDRRQQSQPIVAAPLEPTPPGSRDTNTGHGMSGMAAVARQRGMTQRELEEFLMQPPRGRKPGILTRLGLKKPKNPEHRIRKADVESPSRRDTPLERSRLEREHLRGETMVNGAHGTGTPAAAADAEPNSSSKLLKKNPKPPTGNDSWPLRPESKDEHIPQPAAAEQNHNSPSSPLRGKQAEPAADHARRNSSLIINGGQASRVSPVAEPESPRTARSGPISNDDNSDVTDVTDEHGPSARDVVISGSGRKKRFPFLRKALGLRA